MIEKRFTEFLKEKFLQCSEFIKQDYIDYFKELKYSEEEIKRFWKRYMKRRENSLDDYVDGIRMEYDGSTWFVEDFDVNQL